MPSHVRRREESRQRGRSATAALLAELRAARLDRDVSGRLVSDALEITTGQYSRLERGLTGGLTIEQATIALDAVAWTCPCGSSLAGRRSGTRPMRR
jgi:hypothetical protein